METGWIEALENQRELILIDVRGHGQSSKPRVAESYSHAATGNDVLAVMDARDIEACDFMDYPMGACCAAPNSSY